MLAGLKKLLYLPLVLVLVFATGCFGEKNEDEDSPSTPPPEEVVDPPASPPPPSEPTIVEQGDYRFVFVSTTEVNGSGAITGTGAGLADMDSLCQSDAEDLGLQGEFKAFIADGANRIPGGSDWVIVTGKEYRNLAKQIINVAVDGNAGAGGDLSVLADPGGSGELTNSIHDQPVFVWTGMESNGLESINNCTGWTSTSGYGDHGKASLAGFEMWDLGYSSGWSNYANGNDDTGNALKNCDAVKPIYCVQTLQPPPDGSWKRIFLTTNTTALNVGLSGLDSFCASEASGQGFTGTYKALVGTNTRTACTAGSCAGATGMEQSSDWVLQANMNYRQADGYTHIGTTNEHGIFDFGDGSTSAIEYGFSGTSETYVTGIPNTWVSGTTDYNRCLDFTINNPGAAAPTIGRGNATDGKAIQDSFSPAKNCGGTSKLICVEQ
ncbi:MAG: DUF1554 domain-containing protein [Bdellovibrionales bacterium]